MPTRCSCNCLVMRGGTSTLAKETAVKLVHVYHYTSDLSHDDNPCLAVSQAKNLPLRPKMDSVNAIVLALVELRPLASKRRSLETRTKYY